LWYFLLSAKNYVLLLTSKCDVMWCKSWSLVERRFSRW
jgi:hypothetical protein